MFSQTSSYYPSNDQSVLLQQHYSSPKLDYLPPLSQLLPDNTTDATTPTTVMNSSNMVKNEPMMPGAPYYSTQPPSTILSNSDSPLTSVDLFTPTTTTSDMGNDSSDMLTTVPQYMNDPVTEAATAAAISTNMIYDPNGSTTLASMDPLLATTPATLDGNTMVPTTTTTSMPFMYSNPPVYDSNNTHARHRQTSISSSSSDKAYSFVATGVNQRKRPRRRYDEIERLYHCTFGDCKKSYGTLNHLNSHVLMQNHGPKRHPSEFKEMRKEWRRQRKQKEEQRKQAEKSNKQQQEQQLLHQLRPPPTLTAAFQPPSTYIPTNLPLQSMPLSGFY